MSVFKKSSFNPNLRSCCEKKRVPITVIDTDSKIYFAYLKCAFLQIPLQQFSGLTVYAV